MSTKYNKYAKQLEASFLESREAYAKAADALTKAEQRKADANRWHEEKYTGQREVEKAKAQAAFLEAKSEFDRVADSAWANFSRERDRLTVELHEALRADAVVNPDAIDANTVELLKAGVCSVDDYTALFNRFNGNATMRKLVAKYAEEAAQNASDGNERAKLIGICHDAKAADSAVESAWDSLLYAANICTGQAHGRGDRGYTLSINNRWEELAGGMIEHF